MSKKIEIPKANKGKGYAGVWCTGQLGWWLPNHLSGNGNVDQANQQGIRNGYLKGERVFLCEITIKPLKDKKGRPITKIVKR